MASIRNKTEQMRDMLANKIRRQEYRLGDKLPSLRQMAKEHNVSYITANLALNELRNLGFVEVRPGSGAYVVYDSEPVQVLKDCSRIGLAYLDCHSTHIDQPEQTHPSVVQWLRGFHDYFRDGRASLRLLPFHKPDIEGVNSAVRQAIERHELDGLIVTGWLTAEGADYLLSAGLPFVLIEHELPQREVATVVTDRVFSFKLLATQLAALGHKSIRLITYSTDQEIYHRRGIRYVRAAHSVGFESFSEKDILIVANEDRAPEDYSPINEAIASGSTAIVVMDDALATRLHGECLQRNIRVPEELSFAAIVDSRPGGHILKLTTTNILLLVRETVYAASELLERALYGENISRVHIALTASLIEGHSIAPALL